MLDLPKKIRKMELKNSRKKVDKELHKAIEERNLEDVKTALDNGANINCNVKDYTPLSKAIQANNINTVKFLLEQGADIKAPTIREDFPLMNAMEACKEVAEPTGSRDFTKKTKEERKKELLSLTYDFDIFNLLLEKGADIEQLNDFNRGLIGKAINYFPYHYDIQKRLISKKTVNTDDFPHFQPLYEAINRWDNVESVKLLLSYGAKLKEGTILEIAAEKQAIDVFKFALSNETLNEEEIKKLFSSISKGGSHEILDALVEHLKLINIEKLLEFVPISSFEIYKYLKTKGNIPKNYLSKSLLSVLDNEKINGEFINTLIEDGADVLYTNEENQNVVYICAKYKEYSHFAFLEKFLKLKVPIENALFACNNSYDVDMVELLLQNGANPELKNQFSQTFIESFKEELWNMKDASKQDAMIRRQLRNSIVGVQTFIEWFDERGK